MNYTIQQPKEKTNKPRLPLLFIVSVHFLSEPLESLVKNLGENDYYHLNQIFNANAFGLLNKTRFFRLLGKL